MKDVEIPNTKDAFGNQLKVGDEVYYFKRHGKAVRFGRGVVGMEQRRCLRALRQFREVSDDNGVSELAEDKRMHLLVRMQF